MATPLHIAKVTYQWLKTKGGPSTYVSNVAAELRSRGHEVTVLTSETGPGALHFDPRPGRRELEIFRSLSKLKPDIVHLHGRMHYIPPAWMYKKVAGNRPRVVFTFHTQPYVGPFIKLPGQRKPDYPGVQRFLARFILKLCDEITGVSRNMMDNLKMHCGLGFNRFTVIKSAAAQAKPDQDRLTWLQKTYGLKSAYPVLASIGVLYYDSKVAGHQVCLEALSILRERYPQIKLLIAGDGQYKWYLEELSEKLALGEHVIFLGNFDHIPELLEVTSLYLHLSLHEGCPLALIEAMQAGKPIIAARRGGIPEIIEDGVTGRLIEPDPRTLAKVVTELLMNEGERQRLGANAQSYWSQHLSWKVIAAQYEALFYGQDLKKT